MTCLHHCSAAKRLSPAFSTRHWRMPNPPAMPSPLLPLRRTVFTTATYHRNPTNIIKPHLATFCYTLPPTTGAKPSPGWLCRNATACNAVTPALQRERASRTTALKRAGAFCVRTPTMVDNRRTTPWPLHHYHTAATTPTPPHHYTAHLLPHCLPPAGGAPFPRAWRL